jgi:hypothetical protein
MIKITIKYFYILLYGLLVSNFAFGFPALQCSDKIQPELLRILTKKMPKFRVPSLKDLDQESINSDISNGGDGCFSVISGNFRDDKQNKDYAILLVSKKTNRPKLIVAFNLYNNVWKIYQLRTFCNIISICYVKIGQPGTYNRTQALDFPPIENRNLESLTSKNQVILTGNLESTEVAYAYIKDEWFYVWVGD